MKEALRRFSKRIVPQFGQRAIRSAAWKLLRPTYGFASGVKVVLRDDSDWYIYNEIFVEGDYDAAIDMAIQTTRGIQFNVLDIGANIGLFTLRAAHKILTGSNRLDFRITAVEGNPSTAERLRNCIAENGLADVVEVVHGLVGRKEGIGVITDVELSGNNTAVSNSQRGHRVGYRDLSSLQISRAEIDLLKCDIEGSELEFVRTYPDLLAQARIAVIELHPNLCDTRECIEQLRRAGLSQSRLITQKDSVCLYQFWREGGGQ